MICERCQGTVTPVRDGSAYRTGLQGERGTSLSLRATLALLVSAVSLVSSTITLYETVLRTPRLVTHAAATWNYLRGPALTDETIVVPVTVANHGARPGVVLGVELTLTAADGTKREFHASSVQTAEKDRLLFSPLAIPGRSSTTAVLIFTPGDDTLILPDPASVTATLSLRTTYEKSYGPIDDWAHVKAEGLSGTAKLMPFEISALLGSGKPASIAFVGAH